MELSRKFSKRRYFKSTIVYFLTCCMFFNTSLSVALAGPEGAQVVNGQVSFQQSGYNTTITASDKSIINYSSFDIARPEIVQFIQPGSSASVLNRILSANPTNINGTLLANGRVFFVNPAGVYIGAGARVNVNQLVASGLNITNSDFINGQYNFAGGNGSVINSGDISAEKVYLIGKQVANSGSISCPDGYVVMASGDRVFLGEPGTDVVLEMDTPSLPDSADQIEGSGVLNEGTVDVAGGTIVLAAGDIYSQAISNTGSLSASVEAGEAGQIKLIADGGQVTNTGTIEASGSKGGQVVMEGARVGQFGTVHADGTDSDGGSVDLQASEVVALSSDSLTTANAGTNGNGGEVIAFSPDTALFWPDAKIEAKGGSESGNGGFIEVSGKKHVEIFGWADASSTNGAPGTFLIDPTDITIATAGEDIGDDGDGTFTSNADDNIILDTTIEDYLNAGTSVTLDTSDGDDLGGGIDGAWEGDGDIIQNADATIDFTGAGGSATLELIAERDITLNGGIASTASSGDTLGVTLDATRNVSVTADIDTNGGSFTSSGINFDTTASITGGAPVDETAIDLSDHSGTVTASAGTLNTSSGDLLIEADDNGNETGGFVTIGEAIDAIGTVVGNSIIEVADGTYNENLIVDKPDITLKSVSGPGSTTLTASSGLVVDVQGNGDDFTLGGASGEGFSIDSGANTTFLVQLANAPQDVEISWNEFNTTGNASMGISVGAAGAMGLNINNNTFVADAVNPSPYGDGVIWSDGPITELQINDNDFTGPGIGVSSYAIELSGVAETTASEIADNTVDGFSIGIGIFNGTSGTPTDGLDILRNDIDNCTIGLWLRQYPGDDGTLQNVTVQANTFTGNTKGIEILDTDVDASSISITNNFFVNNTTGVESKHDSQSATIFNNSFEGNVTAVSNSGLLAVLNAQANWWGHASGPLDNSDDTVTGGLYNPGVLGDPVTDKVDYNPWLGIGDDAEAGILGFQPVSPMAWGMLGIDGDSPQYWIDNFAGSGDTLDLKYSVDITLNSIDDGALTNPGVNLNITTLDGQLTVGDEVDVRGSLTFGAEGTGDTDLIVNGDIDPLSLHLFSDDDVTINSVSEADNWILVEAGLDGDGSIIWSSGSLETLNSGGYITMKAGKETSGTSGDIAVEGSVTTDAGNIILNAYDGAVNMTDAGVLDATGGKIAISAKGDIKLGSLQTDSTDTDAITLTSAEGGIIDNGDTNIDIVAAGGGLVIDAATGVGNAGDIETTVASIDIENTTPGSIVIDETDGVDIVLANAGTDNVNITADGTVTDSGAITAETLTVNTSGGAGGAITLDLDTTHDADTINLTSKSGQHIVFKDKDGVDIELANAGTGNVSITADGTVTDSGAITAETLTVNTSGGAGGAITLDLDTTHDADTINLTSKSGQHIVFKDKDGVDIELANAGTGNVSITADGTVTDSGAITAETLTVNTSGGAGGAITLDLDTTHDADTINLTSKSGQHIVFKDKDGVDIELANAGTGNVSITADGTVTDSGAITAETLTVNTSGGAGGAITLDLDTTHDADTINLTSKSGQHIVFKDKDGVDIELANAGTGNVSITADGTVTDSGAITAETLTVNTSGGAGGAITLDLDTTHDADTINLTSKSGQHIVFKDKDGVDIELANAGTGNVSITADGTVTDSGAITAETLTVNTSGGAGGAITLDLDTTHDADTINLTSKSGQHIVFKDKDGVDIELANAGTGNVSITADGTVTDSGAITAETLTVNTSGGAGGAITLDLDTTHDADTINLTSKSGQHIVFKDKDGVDIELANAGTGNVSITADGTVTDSGAITAETLTVNTSGGAGGAITLDLDTTHDADTINLTSKSGQHIVFKDKDGVDIELANAGTGNVSITADGTVTDSGAITAETLTVNTSGGAGGAITLDLDTTHDADTINLTSKSGQHIVFKDKDGVDIELANAGSGDVTITAGGDVTDSGAITAGTLTVKTLDDAGAAITLDIASNDADTIDLRARNAADSTDAAGAITFVDADDVDIAKISTTSPANVTAGGTITVSGSISAGGSTATLTAADNITINANITDTTAISAHAGTDGTGDVTFGAGVTLDAPIVTLRAGDGLDLADTTAVVDLLNNTPTVVANSLTVQQDGQMGNDITPWNPNVTNNATIDLNLQSDDSSIYTENADSWKSITATAKDNIELSGSDDIKIGGDLTSNSGGVSIISDNGAVRTAGDTILDNVDITGYSDGEGGIGVDIPNPDPAAEGIAAIVIKSDDDLEIGQDSTFTANGEYDPSDDERNDAIFREDGSEIDVAVYLRSVSGDIILGSSPPPPVGVGPVIDIVSDAGVGALVVDAYDTVTFNDSFENYLQSPGSTIKRIEAVSRITQTLNTAPEQSRFPHGDNPDVVKVLWTNFDLGIIDPQIAYVLRGEDGGSINEAWLLTKTGPVPLAVPKPLEPEVQGEVDEPDMEALMALLDELGIGVQPFLARAYRPSLNTDLSLLKAAEKLLRLGPILEDADGARIAALVPLIRGISETPVPIEEQMASFVQEIARQEMAGQWMNALSEYVAILNNDIGLPADDSVARVMVRYGGKLTGPVESLFVEEYLAQSFAD